MWSRVYETVERLSVCSITRPQPRHVAGLLLNAVWVKDIDQQRQRRALTSSTASSVTFTADVGG